MDLRVPVYVTGNKGKYISVKEKFARFGLDVDFLTHDAQELEINDIEQIAKSKVDEAYHILKRPCFVIDSGFYIKSYPNNPGYPGAFVKRSGISSDIKTLLATLKEVEDRTATFVDCLMFYDGENYYTFYGYSEGNIAREIRGNENQKARSNLWYVFIPKNHDKTLAEMTDYERSHRNDGSNSAILDFIEWYQNEYLNVKRLTKKTKIEASK